MYDIKRSSRKSSPPWPAPGRRAIFSSAHRQLALLCLVMLFVLLGITLSARAQSTPVTVGHRDFSYGDIPAAEITSEHSQSKLWWNDGLWWGCLWANSTDRYRIHKFDVTTQSWINTGTAVDTRADSKLDALWDGQHLYVASNIFTNPGPTLPANAARLYRYRYDPVAKSYSLDAGFPVTVNSSRSETLVLEKDSSGQLWITWAELGKVMVNRSTGDDLTWGTPFILPVQGNDVTLDDISSIVAFGGNKIGLVWSNQNDRITYFAVHRDNDADEVWQPREQVLVDPNGGAISDDHINLKSRVGSSEVYAVAKTNLSGADANWIVVVKRDADGVWTSHVVAKRSDDHTRPTMMIDRENQKLYVFARSNNTGAGIMYMKSADLSTLQFPPGLGTAFIQSATDLTINNPTSTKQCVDGNTGLLVLASDQNTRFYLHNYIDLSQGRPVITTFTPTSGSIGTEVTITGSNFTGATGVAFNGTAATSFTVDSPTQIRAVVPSGISTGKISVTNAAGTGLSAADFLFDPPPTISFIPLHDAYVKLSTPTTNFGNSITLRQQSSTDVDVTYLKFNVTGLNNPVRSAKLRLFVVNASNDGGSVHVVSNNYRGSATEWTESGLSWDNAPVIEGTALSSAGPVSLETFVDLEVTAAVVGNGIYSFALKNGVADRVYYSSKEGANPPELVIELGSGSASTPRVASFTPASGPVGTEVTISGGNFTGATSVAFGGMTTTSFTVDSDTRIRANVPAGATTGKISVTNAEGTGISTADFRVIGQPSISSFTPRSGAVGMEVTISGDNFTGATGVAFNGTPATNFTLVTDTQILANVPAGASTGKISVTTFNGAGFSTDDFIVAPPVPTTIFNPIEDTYAINTSPTANRGANTNLRIQGQGTSISQGYLKFNVTGVVGSVLRARLRLYVISPSADGGSLYVVSNNYQGTSTPWDEEGLNWNTAPMLSGAPLSSIGPVALDAWVEVDVSAAIIENGIYSFGIGNSTTDRVEYSSKEGLNPPELVVETSPLPVVNSFTPTNGPVGTEVTISGFHFDDAIGVAFNGTVARSFTIDSETQIRAIVPTGATTGKIGVTSDIGTGFSNNDFIVTAVPVITSFTPVDGPVGAEVTLNGSLFTGATSVTFNGIVATGFTVDSDTQIRANVPAGATAGKIGVTNSAGTGLSANNFVVTGLPVIDSFRPNNGPVGTEVTITGTNFTAISRVTFNGTPATNFAVDSNTRIRANVPAGATRGKIGVANSSGAGLSEANFTVTAVPVIASLTPGNGPVGAEVTITGTNFVVVRSVTFNGTEATSFTVDSDTRIRAIAPAGATTGKLGVTNSAGTGLSEGNFIVTEVPGVSSFIPDKGPIGIEVTIIGTNFRAITGVTFNGKSAASFTRDSITQLRAVVPEGATAGKIAVTNSAGTGTSANDFGVMAITSVTPSDGPVGTEVTLTGTLFTGATSVAFNGVAAASFTVDSDLQIRATVPVAPTGATTTGKIGVTSSLGTALTANNFIVTAVPAITSFTPSDGPIGAEITLTGTNFTAATAVTFNGVAATRFTVASNTRLRVNVPAGATSGKIAVTNSAGTGVSANDFIVTAAPAITSFSPTSGPIGTPVAITGSNFTGTTKVTFNGTVAPTFTLDSDTQIRVNVPSGATTGKIAVTNSAGTGSNQDEFIITQPPALFSFTPSQGPAGIEVTITGNGFAGVTTVAFNGAAATIFTVDSNTQIRVTVPAAATTGRISLANSAGTGLSGAIFTVKPLAIIASFTPTTGPVGRRVTITGSNFTGIVGVAFNGTPADFTVDSDTQIRATVPDGATTGKIGVSNADGTGFSVDDFVVTALPQIVSFTPGHGPVGTEVTLTGANFVAIREVTFNGASTSFTVDSETQLRAPVPPNATTGKIAVTSSAGTGSSTNDFTVIAITAFTPSDGPIDAEITLTGAHFTGATGVTFNGTAATNFTVDSDTRIRAKVPAGATTGKIAVINSKGTGSSADDFIVTALPVVASFTPAAGPTGQRVTITGSNFTAVTSVTFNGTPAANFTVTSNTQIRATVPVGAVTGKVGVANSAGTGLSANDFNVLAITAFTPTSGPLGTLVTLTGSLFTGATAVTFNGKPATNFTVDSDTKIRVFVPAGATTGQISVTTSVGTTSSVDAFIVTASPTITFFNPIIGPEGTEVTITGSSFTGATSVTFNNTAATSFTIDSDTQLRAIVPVGATTGRITVANSSGIGFSGAAFTVKPPPTITSFSPRNGPVGRRVTITGTNFTNVTKVAFNGAPANQTVAASFTVDSPTQLRANVPEGATTGKISVTTPDGMAASADNFIATYVPEITAMTPGHGAVGTEITLTGAKFAAIRSVTFNGTLANFKVDSETQLRATVPPGATTGKIGVTNSAGTGFSVDDFTVIAITAFMPSDGPVGTEVTLTGAHFTGTTGVTFNSIVATSFTVDSDIQIRATVPAGATTGMIVINKPAGKGSSADNFIVTEVPTVTSFTPGDGPVETEVTITGAHFIVIKAVTFNGTAATPTGAASFTVDSEAQIRAKVPVGATTGKIGVINSAGTSLSADDFIVTVFPIITSFTPADGPVGTKVTLIGHNFTGVTGVTFKGKPAANFTVDSDTQIRADVPAGATTGKINLANSAGSGMSADDFIITKSPEITSFTPTIGPEGTEVTITGTNFAGTSRVVFNGTPTTNFTVDSNTQIRANVPAGATTGRISVVNSAGTGISGGEFSVKPPPIISSFLPRNGPVGKRVTITGSNFTNVLGVAFNGVPAAVLTLDSSTQIRAQVPEGAATGKISVTSTAGTALSETDFIVTVVPVITAITPGNGPIGSEVTLTGAHFAAITGVTFNGNAAGNFTVDSETQLRATVPPGTTTGKIGVTNSAGTGSSTDDFIVTRVPTVTSFTPGNGPVGAEVTVTGTRFIAITAVSFNGAPSTKFTVDSETQLRATVPVAPAGATTTGKIGVANSAGTGSSADVFVVTALPEIASFKPGNGPVGTEVTLTGTHFAVLTGVTFNGTAATRFTVDSETQLRAIAPAGATTGKIGVSNSAGTGLSGDDFIVTQSPAITSFTPTIGLEGTEVTIVGKDFIGATSVAFNGTPATSFTVDSNTQIRANVPAGATTGKISVTNSAGAGISGGLFTVKPRPTIASFTPMSAPVGTPVTIIGSSFIEVASVTFNGTPATSFAVDSDTQIRANVPVGATTGKIGVTNPAMGGTILSTADFTVTQNVFTFNAIEDAEVKSSAPTSNYGAFGILRLRDGFVRYNTYLKFKVTGLAIPVQRARLRLFVNTGSDDGGSVHAVSNNYTENGAPWDEDDLVWNNAPVISGTPLSAAGAVNAGAFVELDVTAAVTGNGTYSFGLLNRSTSLVAYSSKEGTNSPELIVETTSAPVISSFTPAAGPIETEVTITGINFTGANKVLFNGTAAISFTVDSDTQIRAEVPDGATTGRIRVTNSDGFGLSATDFAVTLPTLTFNPLEDAEVKSSTPEANYGANTILRVRDGSIRYATYLKFNVTGLNGPAQRAKLRMFVSDGSDNGGSVHLVRNNYAGSGTPWEEEAIVWNNAPAIDGAPLSTISGAVSAGTFVELEVTSAITGNGIYSFGFLKNSTNVVTYSSKEGTNPPELVIEVGSSSTPTITAFSPVNGSVGAVVTITGNNFLGATHVAFNGTVATSFTVDSPAQIRAQVPAGATTGKIGVTNPDGIGLSATDFAVTQPTLTFNPVEDAEVKSSTPEANYGANTILRLRDGSIRYATYVKFNVTGLGGPVQRAKLRLFVIDGSASGGSVYLVRNNYAGSSASWEEEAIVWNNAPAIDGAPLSTASGTVQAGTFVELEVTSAITGNGIYSFGLLKGSTSVVTYSSKEGANPPELVIETGSTPLLPSAIIFNPTDDAEVKSSFSTTNYGSSSIMRLRDGAVKYHSYLKFNVTGLSGPVQTATLRLYVEEGSDDGGAVYSISNNYAGNGTPWDENGLVWDNAPSINGTALSAAPQGGVSPGTWVEFDVTAAITGNGIYSFGLVNSSTTNVKYGTKEGANPASQAPELVIRTGSGSSSTLKSAETNSAPEHETIATSLPERLTLYPNHPNPFNAQTTIEYTLPLKASVHLVIFNVAGQPVRRLVNGAQAAGHHRVVWDGKGEGGREVTSGIYYYRLKVDNEIRVRQMTILK